MLVFRQFLEVAYQRYLTAGDRYTATHTALAKYFSGEFHKLYGKERAIPAQPVAYSREALNLRKLELLPTSLMEAGDFEELRNVFGELNFIQTKCMAGLGYDMMAECTLGYHYAIEKTAKDDVTEDLSEILHYLRSEVHILSKDPILTFQQAVNYPEESCIGQAAVRKQLEWEKQSGEEEEILPQPDGWVEWTNKPKVPEPFLFELAGHSKDVLTTCFSRDNT